MLDINYITVDGVGFTPSTFDYSLSATENIKKSEAGTDITIITRLNQHIFNASWTAVTSDVMEAIEKICKNNSVILGYRGREYKCRGRDFRATLVPHSHKYRHSNGLWDVSMSFKEV